MDLLIKYLQDQKLYVEWLKVQNQVTLPEYASQIHPLLPVGIWTTYIASPSLSCLLESGMFPRVRRIKWKWNEMHRMCLAWCLIYSKYSTKLVMTSTI